MSIGDQFLLGVDLVKDVDIMTNAYNDNKRITARFNKNILKSINKIIETDFNLDDFNHYAFYNFEESRIEIAEEARLKVSNIFTDALEYFGVVKLKKLQHTP